PASEESMDGRCSSWYADPYFIRALKSLESVSNCFLQANGSLSRRRHECNAQRFVVSLFKQTLQNIKYCSSLACSWSSRDDRKIILNCRFDRCLPGSTSAAVRGFVSGGSFTK